MVVGPHGALEGNGGDLRTGLPWQAILTESTPSPAVATLFDIKY